MNKREINPLNQKKKTTWEDYPSPLTTHAPAMRNPAVQNQKIWRSQMFINKGTLMQIWKSPYMFVFIQKQYTENLHSKS